MNKGYCVYIHTNKINGKKYVGITGQKPEARWKNGKAYHDNTHFGSAILKYGWNCFEHEVLFDNLTKEEAENKEIELIKKLKTTNREYGYNIQNGGSSIGRFSEETKEKIRQSTLKQIKEKGSPTQGRVVSDDEKYRNMMSQPNRRPVEQIDLDSGCVIREFETMSQAARYIGCYVPSISSVCKGLYKQSHGYGWRFKKL